MTGLVTMVVLGTIAGTLITRVAEKPWGHTVSYGLPSFSEGRWWAVFTGMPFAVNPLCYVAVLSSFAICVGFAEIRMGTKRTMLAFAYGHVAGVFGAAALIGLGGSWTDQWAHALDVGPSGGALATAAIVSATFPAPHRTLLRLGLVGYVVGALFVLGNLADVVHLTAVLLALPVGALFVRRTDRHARLTTVPDAATDLLARHGGGTLSWMATWRGTRYLIAPDGDGYLAYRQHAGVAIALGDPVGSPDWQRAAADEFAAHCTRSGLVPCWFSVGADTANDLAEDGWRNVQVAQDNLIDLPSLKFQGKKWQDVRTARNRAAKEGIEFRLITLADAEPAVLAQVRELSTNWLRNKRMPELGFTLGGITEALDPRVRVGIAVDAEGVVHGVTSWLPIMGSDGRPHGWTLDLMRRRSDGFRLVIDFMIASACLTFQDEGAAVVSLSGAPLARAEGQRPTRLRRLLDMLGSALEPCYGFRSLHAFKSKFQPRTEPLYLVFRHATDLPRIGTAITLAYLRKPATTTHRPRQATIGIEVPAPRQARAATASPVLEPAGR
ncbi:bifunctional lysylphosphatidylglycerol flippase/synthetase MprF [Herbihabitans rhizosphaerae]|uniref:bifunctional lysylphosphatidylglycerol flippase/synthetase MprF n=1 Tax=Herbihabitans rhizosphaerae TaxID=1872711 RepID=UPI001F5FA183|nr:DUF2156 domain-containing protein [Herbihabitans rhizosphaerae]